MTLEEIKNYVIANAKPIAIGVVATLIVRAVIR